MSKWVPKGPLRFMTRVLIVFIVIPTTDAEGC